MTRWRTALRRGRWPTAAALIAIAASLVASMAVADNILNDVVSTAEGKVVTVTAGGSGATVKYGIQPTGAGATCDAADGSGVTVTPTGLPAGVTKSPASVGFTSCPSAASGQGITFTAGAATIPNDYVIGVTAVDTSGSYNVNPGAFTLRVVAPPPPADTTPPVITPLIGGTLGNAGWHTSDVTVSWTIVDNESAPSPAACASTTITTDTSSAGTTVTCTSTSAGGTTIESVTVRRDATPPTLSPTVSPNPVLLNGSATATPGASDPTPGSGLASSSCDTPDTSSVGAKTVTCNAEDVAGNTSSAPASYSVIFDFDGFFQPIDGLPTINTVKAGSSIPVKFSLDGNQGLSIFAAGSPSSKAMSCSTTATSDPVEETSTAGNSTLQYDALLDQYVYVWKTEKGWANTCRQLTVKLIDGTSHTANFKLK